jgi:ankyrin repeat protein
MNDELFNVSLNGDYGSLKKLIDDCGDINRKYHNEGNMTALMLAIWNDHVDCATLLLDSGANINDVDKYGWTALKAASYTGAIDCVKLLLEYGADPNIKDSEGWTALMNATRNAHTECADLLEAYTNAINTDWKESTHCFFPKRKRECINTLITLWNCNSGILLELLPLELVYEISKELVLIEN